MNTPFLYKYKPKYLEDFFFDDDLKNILNTFVAMDNLNILLHGPSGCGKTSLIHTILNLYYKNEKYNDNVLIINNLMEQGISYYRTDVKTFCQTRGNIANKKKFVILDDIDFISEQSQQAFRTCIDKYQQNVHFISSCTSITKSIESIQSRMYIIKLPNLTNDNIMKITNKICESEHITITQEAKELAINISNNSPRNLINYLEKFKLLDQNIDTTIVSNVSTNIVYDDLKKYTQYCKERNLKKAVPLLHQLHDSGYSVMDIFDNYFTFIKLTDQFNEAHKYSIIALICKFIVVFHNIHEDEIELAIFTNNLISII